MSKLIIEHDTDGSVFLYHESERHFRKVEKQRKAEGKRRVDWDDVAEECRVDPGTYMVVPIVDVE